MIENENKQIEILGKYQNCKKGIKGFFFRSYGMVHSSINLNPGFTFIILLLSFTNIFSYLINEENNIYNISQSAQYAIIIPRILSISYYIKQSEYIVQVFTIIIFAILLFEFLMIIYLSIISKVENKDNKVKDLISTRIFYYFSLIFYWLL